MVDLTSNGFLSFYAALTIVATQKLHVSFGTLGALGAVGLSYAVYYFILQERCKQEQKSATNITPYLIAPMVVAVVYAGALLAAPLLIDTELIVVGVLIQSPLAMIVPMLILGLAVFLPELSAGKFCS